MNFIVTFGNNKVRIIKGINPADFANTPGIAVNPDLSQLRGIPPHMWKLEGNTIQVGKTVETPTIISHTFSVAPLTYLKAGTIMVIVSALVHVLLTHLGI